MSSSPLGLLLIGAAALLLGASAEFVTFDYPATKTVDVTTSYFGTTVRDPYRWLEAANAPDVRAWAAAQTKFALDYLTEAPAFGSYKKRVTALDTTPPFRGGLTIRGGRFFYRRFTPPQPQPDYVVLDRIDGPERVLYHPIALNGGGAVPALETVAVDADGAKVAYTTQLGGSEDETLHVVDVATGRDLPDVLPHVGGGASPVAIAWDGEGKGFIHTRWPQNADGTYATSGMLLYHHVLGTDPATDTYVFGNGLSPKAEYTLATSLDGSVSAISVTAGDGVHASIYLRSGKGPYALVAAPDADIGASGEIGGAFVGNAFYAIAKKRDSRGEIVALTSGGTFDSAATVVSASQLVVQAIVPVKGGFATEDIDGGDSAARIFERSGKLLHAVPVPPISLASISGDPAGGPIVIRYQNYTTDARWLAYEPSTDTTRIIPIPGTDPTLFSNIVAERVLVPSLDGKVSVPLEIVHAKDLKKNGSAPTILTAYGAYGTVSTPYFDPTALAWLERGGVLAQAMIRGGGEYGEDWHLAAHLATKTVSSDDVAACAMWLEKHGYGTNRHLGILGGSAGGFLMGLALTRNPRLYRAVDSQVGIYDLLRVELTPNGAFNTPEFGTVKDPAQFAWMIKQSPYHNVHKGVAYPAVLMTTGENDPRVDPYNSRKMIAMLQADTSSKLPVLLVQRAGQGHGIGNSFDQDVEESAEEYAFFDRELR